jgi:hypothetical protein
MKYFLLLSLLFFTACDFESADQQQHIVQERMNKQSNMTVGMPSIVNFQEKRILKNILELRDTEIKTVTYTQDMTGKLHKLCTSIGYGIPYATQFTNPMRITSGGHELPQADPNGLFSPTSAEGTWVLCLNPETSKMSPVYVEPKVIVSPFELLEK